MSSMIELTGDVYAYVGTYQDETRIRIKKLKQTDEGKMEQDGHKGISLTIEQWEKLHSAEESITAQIQSVEHQNAESKKSWRLSPNRFVSVNRIRSAYWSGFLTLINIRVYFMTGTDLPENPTRYGITLNVSQWENLVRAMRVINNRLKPDDREMDGNKTKQIALESVAGSLLDKLEEITKEQCSGCRVDHPSQREHMADGCLMSNSEKIDMYFERAKSTLADTDVKLDIFKKAIRLSESELEEVKVWRYIQDFANGKNDEEIKAMMESPNEKWEFIIRVV